MSNSTRNLSLAFNSPILAFANKITGKIDNSAIPPSAKILQSLPGSCPPALKHRLLDPKSPDFTALNAHTFTTTTMTRGSHGSLYKADFFASAASVLYHWTRATTSGLVCVHFLFHDLGHRTADRIVVPFFPDPKKKIDPKKNTCTLERRDYKICSDIDHYQRHWNSLNAVVICRGICSGLARKAIKNDPSRLLRLGEALKSLGLRPISHANAIPHLKRHLTKFSLEAPQFRQNTFVGAVEQMMHQNLSLPAEMETMIAAAASDSKAWAVIVYIEHIQRFLDNEPIDAHLREHMKLEHPKFMHLMAREIEQSRRDFIGNSYVAIKDHDYHKYDHVGYNDYEWWYKGRGKKIVISLDHFGCRAVTALGDAKHPAPRGLKYRVIREDELAYLWCKV
jgi:hypothetical protein